MTKKLEGAGLRGQVAGETSLIADAFTAWEIPINGEEKIIEIELLEE